MVMGEVGEQAEVDGYDSFRILDVRFMISKC